MDYHDVMKEIEKGDLAPVYFFFGTEVFLVDQLVNKIVEKGIDPATKDFNCDIVEGEQVDGASVVGLASAYPMMSDRRVVVVKSIQRLSTSDKKRILEYVQSPLESTCLVLTTRDVDRRQSFYKSLTKSSHWVECADLYENQAVDWVKRTARQKGVNLSHEGAVLMVQQVGTSLWNLSNEIEKLLTYAWGEKTLDLKHVHATVGFSRQFNTWEFTDAVGQKNFDKAIALAVKLLEAGQSPGGLIVSLSQRLFLLMQIRSMLDKGMSPPQVTQALKFRPYFARLYLNQVTCYNAKELESGVRVLLQADCALKTGYIEPLMALTLVIHHLIRGSGSKMLP